MANIDKDNARPCEVCGNDKFIHVYGNTHGTIWPVRMGLSGGGSSGYIRTEKLNKCQECGNEREFIKYPHFSNGDPKKHELGGKVAPNTGIIWIRPKEIENPDDEWDLAAHIQSLLPSEMPQEVQENPNLLKEVFKMRSEEFDFYPEPILQEIDAVVESMQDFTPNQCYDENGNDIELIFNLDSQWRDVAQLEESLKENLEREAKRQTGCANAKCKINFIES